MSPLLRRPDHPRPTFSGLLRTAGPLAPAFLLAGGAAAQAPAYTAELLGPGVVINDMNLHGEVVGWTLSGGVQAFRHGPAGPTLLPLLPGHASAWAQGVNDAGVVVGSSSTEGFPEFGQPVAWYPDGRGGYDAQLLALPAGHTQGVAYDVNDRGDVVGVALTPGFQGGPSVWFNAPGGPLNVSALGAPSSPKEVNDEGVVVGISGPLFDLDTLASVPLLPPLAAGMSGFQGWAINDAGELAGKGYHGGVAVSASSWRQAFGWVAHSPQFSLSAQVQAFDVNAAGVVVFEAPAPAAAFPAKGAFTLDELVAAGPGGWSFFQSLGGAVNDAGQIAATGTGPGGQGGVVLLTPSGEDFADLGGGLAGASGVPSLEGAGALAPGAPLSLHLTGAARAAQGFWVVGFQQADLPFAGGVVVPSVDLVLPLTTTASGAATALGTWWTGATPGWQLLFQVWLLDAGGPAGFAASNAIVGTTP